MLTVTVKVNTPPWTPPLIFQATYAGEGGAVLKQGVHRIQIGPAELQEVAAGFAALAAYQRDRAAARGTEVAA